MRGEVDLRATEAVVERFIQAGVSGISPLGSTGEFSHLLGDERKRLVDLVRSARDGELERAAELHRRVLSGDSRRLQRPSR